MNPSHILRTALADARVLTLFVFVAASALYFRTAGPTLGGGHDSAEFQHVAYTLGIAHPTGYPLYLALGKIATTLLPLGNIAYRMNLLSVFLGALAVMFVYLSMQQLTRRPIAAFTATALFATNVAVWRQAGVASVSPLNLLLFAALMYAVLRWHARRAGLIPVAIVLGLGLAHHRSIILLAPAILILFTRDDFDRLRHPGAWLRLGIAFAAPLLLYLYLPAFGNGSPWYSNTLEGFFTQVSASEVGSYVRVTPGDWLAALETLARFLLDSFGVIGLGLIALGVLGFVPRAARLASFLGLATFIYATWTIFFNSEQDRYFALPFFFLIYWFALGIDTLEDRIYAFSASPHLAAPIARMFESLRLTFALVLVLLIVLPLPARWRAADWSQSDREYTLWNEIFSLPIPNHVTLVGDWRQLNGMRYFQRVENRRPDLQLVGTMYDAAPQTDAARAAFADGRAIFLAPGLALPLGDYRYAQLGPLLEVRDKPQTNAPAAPKNIAITSALTLAHYEITTALEPYAPATRLAPTRTARATLVWRAEDRVTDFLVRVRLYDPEGRAITQKDEPPVRGLYPASQWARGEYVRAVHNIQIPGGTPPGTYQLKLQTLDAATKSPTSDEIALGSFAVERATNLTREQVFVAHSFTIVLSDQIEMWGYGGFGGRYRAGEPIGGNLVFVAHKDVGADLTLLFALVDPSDQIVQTWQVAPIPFYPTREWKQGETLKAYYDLRDLPVGAYTLAVGFDAQDLIKITKIEIAP
ncbi:MAG: DUF2723 domain-containing protein [Chloroflexi bacterium]|nr:DUF2723 domain-containing protein [Chloroflexota bacterium]